MDAGHLAALLEFIRSEELDIHSLLVVRHGVLVLESYFYPYRPETRHAIYSSTKSVTSALIGSAIADGALQGIETPLLELFPARTVANIDPRKQAITLEHLLTMSSGLDWRRPAGGGPPPVYAFERSEDRVQFVLDRPVSDEPGSVFFYNSGGSYLLAALLQQRTGMPALDYARKQLFEPIGVTSADWPVDASGVNNGSTGLWMTPRDMARFGLLYARRGQWKGAEVIPAAWVDSSLRSHIALPDEAGHGYDPSPNLAGYGYQWWIPSFGGAAAIGFGGQHIFVDPEQDLVVVVTGTTPDKDAVTPLDLLQRFVLPAVKSSTALPPNAAAAERVAELAADVQRPPRPRPVPPLPPMAGAISGKTFRVQSADGREVEQLSLTFSVDADTAVFEGMIDGKRVRAAVGLDGVDRVTATDAGQVLLQGWWKDGTTFVMDQDILGEAVREEVNLEFAGERVIATYHSYVYDNVFTMEGEQVVR